MHTLREFDSFFKKYVNWEYIINFHLPTRCLICSPNQLAKEAVLREFHSKISCVQYLNQLKNTETNDRVRIKNDTMESNTKSQTQIYKMVCNYCTHKISGKKSLQGKERMSFSGRHICVRLLFRIFFIVYFISTSQI